MIKFLLLVATVAIVAFVWAGRAYARRLDTGRTRSQQLDRQAIERFRRNAVRITSLPPERTMVEIAAPRTRAELTLEEWLAESESACLRAEVMELQTSLAVMATQMSVMAEEAAERLARSMGYAGGVAAIRADELIEKCHGDRTELVEHVNEAVPWPMDDELAAEPDLSDDALAAIVDEWISESAVSA